jgi:hypothetical protein
MKSRNPFLAVVVVSLLLANSTLAQNLSTGIKDKGIEPSENSFAASAEKLVRAAYEKLTRYNRAYLLVDDRMASDLPSEERYLRFELRNFKIGPIQEILSLKHSEVHTVIVPEVISLARLTTTLNGGDPHVAYSARWIAESYAPGYDARWTMNDLMSHEAAKYQDVGAYAAYDVTVRFQGKVRAYRALVLFHNPYGSTTEKLKPTFWDIISGSAGALKDLWEEQRPAVGETRSGESGKGSGVAPPSNPISNSRYSKPDKPSSLRFRILPATSTSSDTVSVGPVVESTTEDWREHSSGSHGERVEFQGACEAPSTTQQLCRVKFGFIYLWENGTVTNLIYRHRNRYDNILGTQTGPRGTAISCHSAYGIATQNCINQDCAFTASLTGSGFNIQMTGGDVWRGQLVHGHTCNIPLPRGGGGGSCNDAPIALAKTLGKAPRPNLMNPNCCSSVEQANCFNGGGEWTESTCSCYSPIVIDVAGNGFDLTNAEDGVLFDVNRIGTREQVSWTSANSDDSWLVLDRNGNGVIDDGKELFGSASPQPFLSPGESKHGFRALAMFDQAENGGNGDGQIDSQDAVFSNLKLWRDINHNGISEGGELQALSNSDVRVIELDYKESRRRDDQGNWFRYRAKVRDAEGADVGRWAWDVFLQKPH